jgi:hypothetical protein
LPKLGENRAEFLLRGKTEDRKLVRFFMGFQAISQFPVDHTILLQSVRQTREREESPIFVEHVKGRPLRKHLGELEKAASPALVTRIRRVDVQARVRDGRFSHESRRLRFYVVSKEFPRSSTPVIGCRLTSLNT